MIVSVVLHAQGRQFPFPSVPGTLRTPEDRLQYLGIHYWDRFDFRSQSLLADKDVTEQGFVNFLDLSPAIQQDIITRLDPGSTFC